MSPRVSAVIPAYREAGRIGETVRALEAALRATLGADFEILVVDDGSPDATAEEATAAGARVIRLEHNRGKGAALTAGLNAAGGEVLLLLDADLQETASQATALLRPILSGEADMTVAAFPKLAGHRGGFGFVQRLARWAIDRAGAVPLTSPLSGQRALTRKGWERIGRLDPGFGLEMGLNLDAARLGLRVIEVPTTMRHRLTGRDWAGFRHRARQFRDVALSIARRWPLGRAATRPLPDGTSPCPR